ncbi:MULTISPECIES: metalloprotease TldD [unclassified Alcanivorax]|jgi:TldD protein|uniref:metalloprotease TldD n=1 Tax=unclassified Alcanivorax TaxID=2638842 RepID=UPI00017EE14C|nr:MULTISPECIES: metalloprotease TldD [unclassified Alcanivorax]EDX89352.1 TldD/PmbA family [Alcanivorax sp. DG881]
MTQTDDALSIAESVLLAPANLHTPQLASLLNGKLTGQADYADIYFQHSRHEAWVLEDGIVRDASFNTERGAGVRIVQGDKTGFAYSDDITLAALQQASGAARAITRQGQDRQIQLASRAATARYTAIDPLLGWPAQEKVALLQRIDAMARSLDPAIVEVTASLSAEQDVVMVVASDGTLAADVRPLIRCNVSVIAERAGRRERGSAGGGGRVAYDWLLQEERIETWTREAVRGALLNLEAEAAPAGTMPVVLGPGWPGVLLHEAVGHGLEGDFNRKGTSMFAKKMGELVASPLCSVVDDGTLMDRRGSLSVDDEGTPSACNTLIENGKLVGYMQDKTNARLMGVAPTGNGRRESYAHLPMPRMTNTYMLPGESDPQDIIASLDRGIYAVNFAGGQVDITSGRFVFSTSEAYLVEKGKIVCPVKGATLIGSGAEVMRGISMVGNDLALDSGIGVCGKDGQSVPVGVGQPTLRVDALTVGGTA